MPLSFANALCFDSRSLRNFLRLSAIRIYNKLPRLWKAAVSVGNRKAAGSAAQAGLAELDAKRSLAQS